MPGILTVITPPSSTRLAALPVVKDELGITDAASDIQLGQLIDRASAIIVGSCGRTFGLQSVAEVFRLQYAPANVGPYGSTLGQVKPLVLSLSNVVSIDSVNLNGTVLDGTVPDYEADYGAGLLYRLVGGNQYVWAAPTVTLAYTAGWALPNDLNRNLPADIEDACLALVKAGFYGRARDPSIALDMLNGDRTQFWERSAGTMALDEGLKDQLRPYRAYGW